LFTPRHTGPLVLDRGLTISRMHMHSHAIHNTMYCHDGDDENDYTSSKNESECMNDCCSSPLGNRIHADIARDAVLAAANARCRSSRGRPSLPLVWDLLTFYRRRYPLKWPSSSERVRSAATLARAPF